ncbi:MAG: SurA N-terminal domain-containing protein [Limisphaerales bacterium]
MFAHIRRHQKWLWIFISAAVIISFVAFFSPTQQMQGGGPATDMRATVGSIYGDPITQRQYVNALREAELDYRFRSGNWPENDQFARQMGVVERETRNRLFLARKVKDADIQVDDKAVAEWIATFFADRQTKQYSPDLFNRIMEEIKQRRGMSEADFERYVRNQVGIEHLVAVAGAAGKLVTPQEVERTMRQENEKVDTKVVVFPLSNFVAKVDASPEAVANYYTNAVARYRLPPRLQLSYVAFPSSNYFAQADQRMSADTNLNQQLDMAYLQRGPQFFTGVDGQPLTPEAAKAQMRQQMRDEYALMEARKAAFALAGDLENIPVQPNIPNPAEPLETLAATKGLTAQVTQPFSEFEGPKELPGLPEQFTRVAFQLTPEQPIIQEPIAGEEGVYMFALKRKLESEVQPLDAIREQVTEDFRRNEALRLAREAATAFVAAATNAPAGGTNFDAAAQQAGVAVVDLPPMSRKPADPVEGLPPLVDAGALRSAATDLKPGEVSPYVPTREGGFVVTLEKVIPPTNEEVQQGLPQFAQEYRRRMAVEAFNDWFANELQSASLQLNDGRDREEG